MTGRARWLILPGCLGLFLGVLRGQTLLSVLSLSLLVWVLSEWLLFLFRCHRQIPRLQFLRMVNGRAQSGSTLWAGRAITVEVRMTVTSGRQPPRSSIRPVILVRDILPEQLELLSEGSNELLVLEPCRSATFQYRVQARSAGHFQLPGLHLTVQGANGLFRRTLFIELPRRFRVLPACIHAATSKPLIKRTNALPQHGIHRLQRSGMGSELLELREYVPGDPPRAIAWKVSARRDKLMTRQYESEVPVRVQLIVDGSISLRLGGYGCRLLDQLIEVAASVAKAAVSAGDPVGLILCDERGQQKMPAAGGERGLYRVLSALCEFSDNPVPLPRGLTARLLQQALMLACERCPELLDDRVNLVPFTFLPLLPWNRRRFHERTLLAGVLAHRYGLPLVRQVQLLHDDSAMALQLQQFLHDAGMSWMEPHAAVPVRGFHDGLPRTQMLNTAVTSAVAHARDNEVFVILSDLLECTPRISWLLPSVRTALARHHRLVFVCPTPTFIRPTASAGLAASDRVEDLLFAAEQVRTRNLAVQLKRELRRPGVTVAFSGGRQAIRQVLAEMNLARTGRVAGPGGHR